MRLKTLSIIAFMVLLLSSPVLAQEWTYLGAPSPEPLRDIFFLNEYVGWAVGGAFIGYPTFPSAVIYKTTEGGLSWTPQEVPVTEQLLSVHFASPAVGWIVGTGNVILHTPDGGETWQQQDIPEDIFSTSLTGVKAASESVVYAVGWPGSIIKTVDGGRRWVTQESGTDHNLHAIEVVSSEVAYAVGSDGTILKTTDGGAHWDRQEQILSPYGISLSLRDIICFNEANCKIAASNDYICSTSNGGEEWGCERTGGVTGFNSLSFIDSDTGWLAGGAGGGVRFTDNGEWSRQTADEPFPFHLRSVQAFESICSNAGMIAYMVGDSSVGSAKVFRYGVPPPIPVPEMICDFGALVPQLDANGCITGHECPEEEPGFTVTIAPPRPLYVPSPECPAITDDCEAGYNPLFEYDADGCAVSYTCINFEQESGFSSEKLSEFVAKVPGLSPNEKITVYVARTESEPLILNFELENGKVKNIVITEKEDWTLKAETTEETLNKILAAEDPATEALAAINSKDIKLSGRTVGKKIKLAFLKMGLKLAGIFG